MYHEIKHNGIQPMIWETDPKLRNVNNICSFSVPKEIEINIGDKISHKLNAGANSVYEIAEIIENRQSSLSERNYLIARTNWNLELINEGNGIQN